MTFQQSDIDKAMSENPDLARANRQSNPINLIRDFTPEKVEALKRAIGVKPESEASFQTWVIEYAHLKGWLVAHFRPARIVKDGKVSYRTAVSADGAGFPDLVLVRNGVVIFAECKSETGKPSPAQELWLTTLMGDDYLAKWGGRGSFKVFVWRPSDRERIMDILE